jgi:hypothetical protein
MIDMQSELYCSPLEQWSEPCSPDLAGELAAIKIYWRSQSLSWDDERLIQWFERSGIKYPDTAALHGLSDLAVKKLAHDLQQTFGRGGQCSS